MNYEHACYVLGIDNSMDITIELLKRQYKLMALQYHPDKNHSPDASEKFQKINNSYHYLLKTLEYGESDDDDGEDNDGEDNENRAGYKWVLYRFLKNIFVATSASNEKNIFYKIIEKITTTCESKALDTLEKIDKEILIKIHDILNQYKDAFHFSTDFFNKVEEIIKRKLDGDECVILHPTIDDLFENNLYKLTVDGKTYIIPLWHHELLYDHSGNDLYVKCNPILDNNIKIDEKNNLYISLELTIKDIWYMETVPFRIGSKMFSFHRSDLCLLENQTIILPNEGISRINTKVIYDVSLKSNIIVSIHLTL